MLSTIFAKISSYNIVNYMIPGTALCILLNHFVGWDLIDVGNWYLSCLVFYFSGMVCSRVGSLIVEKSVKAIFGVKFADYEDYIRAEKKDEKLGRLNEESNAFRTYIAMMVILVICMIWNWLSEIFPCIKNVQNLLFVILLLAIFIGSYIKQVDYIARRVRFFTKN